MIKLILTFFLVTAAFATDVVQVNKAVDDLLDMAKLGLKLSGKDKIVINNIDKTIEKKVFGVPIQGEFHASGGLFQDASSIKRTGDVQMQTEGNALTLAFSLGMDLVEVDFSHYSFQLLAIHSEGSIHAACTKNSISAAIQLVYDGSHCSVNLLKAQIVDLGGFDVKLVGGGDWNPLGSMLFTWILNHFNEQVRGQVNDRLETSIRKSLDKAKLCDKIHF